MKVSFFGLLCFLGFKSGLAVEEVFDNRTDGSRELIYRGDVVDASKDPYPFMLALYMVEGGVSYFACGASLIHERWALTASHCANQIKKVSYGAYIRNPSKSYVEIEQYYLPFGRDAVGKDLALVKFKTPIKGIAPIALSEDPDLSLEGATAIAMGYGKIEGDIFASDKKLRQATVKVQPISVCSSKYNYVSTASHICVLGTNREGPCLGDSGSPLIVKTSSGYVQTGVVSRGEYGCSGSPVVYARLDNVISKLQTYMSKDKITLVGGKALPAETERPTPQPTKFPTVRPTRLPTAFPTRRPTSSPTSIVERFGSGNKKCSVSPTSTLPGTVYVGECFRACVSSRDCLYFDLDVKGKCRLFGNECAPVSSSGYSMFSLSDVLNRGKSSKRYCKSGANIRKFKAADHTECAKSCYSTSPQCNYFYFDTRYKYCYIAPTTCVGARKSNTNLWDTKIFE